MGILHPEERRLTQSELDERVSLVRFENIINPINNVCSITHDVFEPTQLVARIRHCGHVFNSESLAHWLRMNNTCPTCRHNLLNSSTVPSAPTPTASTAPTRGSTVRRIDIPLESELNINTFYNELLQNSQNIPGFELDSVNDDSIVFSFDLMNRTGSGTTRSGPTGSGTTGSGTTGSGTTGSDPSEPEG